MAQLAKNKTKKYKKKKENNRKTHSMFLPPAALGAFTYIFRTRAPQDGVVQREFVQLVGN